MNTQYYNYIKNKGMAYFYNLNKQEIKPKITPKKQEQTKPQILREIPEIHLFSYAGSKKKYKQHFQTTIQKMGVKKVNVYIESFAGALQSLFINMEMIQADKIVINDFNNRLINLYKEVKENPKRLYLAYKMLEDKYESLIPKNAQRVRLYPKSKRYEIENLKKMFFYIRDYLNKDTQDYVNAACWLFVLNRCFNGLYNENKNGDCNSSFNWSTKSVKMEKIKDSIFNLSKFFNENNVVFENLDVNVLVDKYNDKDTMIYMDPPYINSSIQYNKKNKDSFNFVETHLKLLKKTEKYRYVLYSNNNHQKFIDYFDSYINFNRTNKISNNDSKNKEEILSFKVNKQVINNIDYELDTMFKTMLNQEKITA